MKNLLLLSAIAILLTSCNQLDKSHRDSHEVAVLPFIIKTELSTIKDQNVAVITIESNDGKTYYPGFFNPSEIEHEYDFMGDLYIVDEEIEFDYKYGILNDQDKIRTRIILPIESKIDEVKDIAIFSESVEYVKQLKLNKAHSKLHIQEPPGHIHITVPN